MKTRSNRSSDGFLSRPTTFLASPDPNLVRFCESQGLRPLPKRSNHRPRDIHEDDVPGPTGNRFESQRARSGEEIEDTQFIDRTQTREQRFPNAITRGSYTGRHRPEVPPAQASADDPHRRNATRCNPHRTPVACHYAIGLRSRFAFPTLNLGRVLEHERWTPRSITSTSSLTQLRVARRMRAA